MYQLFEASLCLLSNRVTELEASKLEESREQREEFNRLLKAEVLRQAEAKHIKLNIPK